MEMNNTREAKEQAGSRSMRAADRLGNAFHLEYIQCPICQQDQAKELGLRGGKYQRLKLGIETTVVRCCGCGLLYPNPFPFPEDPQHLYSKPEKYFEHHSISEKITSGKELLEQIRIKTGRNCPNVLDVGSGRGELLKAAKDSGLARAVGLEFSPAMIEYAGGTWGIDVRLQSIEEHADGNAGAYDAVVLNAVLEHVYRPDLMIGAAARLLRRDGLLYIDCPNEPNLLTMAYALLARVRRSHAVLNLAPTFPPFHVFGFNPRSLTVLLAKNGLNVERISLRGGPLSFRPVGFVDTVKASVANRINAIANITGTAHNMTVWARLVRDPQADNRHLVGTQTTTTDEGWNLQSLDDNG